MRETNIQTVQATGNELKKALQRIQSQHGFLWVSVNVDPEAELFTITWECER